MALLIVVTIIVVFPIPYVAFPNTAQDAINNAELMVTSQSILVPSMKNFQLEQTTVFVTNSSERATLDPWDGSLCLAPDCRTPFVRVRVPGAQAGSGTQIQISNTAEIINVTEFNKYTRMALGRDEYNFYLVGKGMLHKGAWPATTVAYNKKITMRGLQHDVLPNHHSPLGKRHQGKRTISIPNPSVSQFELGDLTMNMSVDGMPVGTASLPNVFIAAGNNSIPMTATTNVMAVAGLVSGPYKSGVLPVDVVVTSVIYDGEHIPWYEQALAALSLRLDLGVIPALQESGLAGIPGLGAAFVWADVT
ncbi:hypothetical protein A1O7_02765 [Cladophialophora yegresii CBS 114405]|uniref:Uncharacterized protein n=1 Tax=Cladophialophora yegresii CBS 114405 TaxID=1182544 RepID=W9WCQ9_9EURO|nr:uncharacterized protein A1O7_02765 [Cladophialophora yegresii CBS 114405]EXJ62331.1 hypothetical protein A1O7_02765 [Cladophialophora yegresii CBS 114405]